MEIKGIDVSSYQGKPDWKKVKNAGIQFAILRITERYGVDASFWHNYQGCIDNGIPVGVYKYSYAMSVAEIQEEAEAVIDTLGGRELDFPIWLDLEYDRQRELPKSTLSTMVKTFWAAVTSAGYRFGIYSNKDWYDNVIPSDCKQYDFWIAAYPYNDNGTIQERLRPTVGAGWQYSSKGRVSGIHGNVDMDVFYKNYKEETSMYSKNDAINRVISIASGEIGYLEKSSNSQLDDKTANAGSNNYTKYWRDVYPAYQGQAWCAAFVSWIFMKAFDQATAAALIKHWPYVYCPTLAGLFTQYANPEVGDIVIFYRGGTFAHTGIVTAVNGDKFTTIEGNTSGASGVIANGGGVCAKSYFNSKLPGTKFCRIDWNVAAAWMDEHLGNTPQKDYLCEGDQGEAVKVYQKNLIEIGYNCGKNGADGDFGPATKAATQEFQGDYGLEQDGNAGPATQKKLSAEVKKKEQTQKGFARFVGEVQKTCAVHEAAKKASPAITGYPKLAPGNLVDVLGRYGYQDGWYKVYIADEHIGYVWADSVKPVDTEAYKDNRTEQGFARFVGEVQKTCVVHLEPKKASDAITGWPKLVKGNRVDVLGRDGYEDNWYKVCVADQYIGYAWADSIKKI